MEENQESVSEEIDKTIICLCKEVCHDGVSRDDKAKIASALALLLGARGNLIQRDSLPRDTTPSQNPQRGQGKMPEVRVKKIRGITINIPGCPVNIK